MSEEPTPPEEQDPVDASAPVPGPGQPQGDAPSDSQSQDLRQAEEAIASVENAAAAVEAAAGNEPADLIDFPESALAGNGSGDPAGIKMLGDVTLRVKIELGRTRMYVEDVLRLNEDSVIELDKAAGDPVDIFVNDRHVARGEVLVLNENFCVRVSEIISGTGSERQDSRRVTGEA